MYTEVDYPSKVALKRAVAAGDVVHTYQPGGMFPSTENGTITLEGPHYPKPHRWYATVVVKDGVIVKGSVK